MNETKYCLQSDFHSSGEKRHEILQISNLMKMKKKRILGISSVILYLKIKELRTVYAHRS